MDLKKYKAFLNEQELPNFSKFDKMVLQYAADNIENLEEGVSPHDVANAIFYSGDGIIIYYDDGIKLLESYYGDNGEGWTNAIEYLYERTEEDGIDSSVFIGDLIKNGRWDSLGNHLLFYRGEELLLASEVLAQLIAANEDEMTKEDIEDLENELEFLAS
jgi:hypothetical protein